MDKNITLKATAFVVGLVVVFFFIAKACDTGSGEEYYYVPGVSVEVDKGKKHYKPAPKPAPKFGGSVGRKR